MHTNAPQQAADRVALHRSQRALVAASLLACPPRTTRPAPRHWA